MCISTLVNSTLVLVIKYWFAFQYDLYIDLLETSDRFIFHNYFSVNWMQTETYYTGHYNQKLIYTFQPLKQLERRKLILMPVERNPMNYSWEYNNRSINMCVHGRQFMENESVFMVRSVHGVHIHYLTNYFSWQPATLLLMAWLFNRVI